MAEENAINHDPNKEKRIKVFANITRLRIIVCLYEKQRDVACIVSDCSLSQSAISQHLKILKEQNIIACRRYGKRQLYKVIDPKAARLAKSLLKYLER